MRIEITRPSARVAAIAAWIGVVLLLGLAAADYLGGPRINTSVIYGLALLTTIWTRSRRVLWAMTTAAIALTLIVQFIDGSDQRALFHRFLTATSVVVTAVLLDMLLGTLDQVESSHEAARRHNESLEEVNHELAVREAEAARQNEALQSQTEELERQGEELRVTNEELVARERMLEHLLGMSRKLASEQTRSEVMGTVCESLGFLMRGRPVASAIVERHGPEVVVVCDHGFGDGGVSKKQFPADKSFTQLVLSRGQTGFLEDMALRPDLELPAPADGRAFKSVLAAPLRVAGKVIGCLEVYSPERQAWTDDHLSLIELLAAQASISLEAAELFEQVDRERGRFQGIFRTLPAGVIVSNADFTEVRANPAAAAMLNQPVDANLVSPQTHRGWRVLCDGRALELHEMPLYRAVIGGEDVVNDECELVVADGRRFSLLISASPMRGRDGAILGGASAFIDVTPLKDLERELDRRRREAEEAALRKTRFLAAVSHDIRTPANAINLLAELIRRSAANAAMAHEIPSMAGELQSSATALVNLVTDVLDLARYDTGRVELHETEFDLASALREEVRQLSPVAAAKNLSLAFDSPVGSMQVRTDRIKLGRVVSNLLSNAIKFTNDGSVTVDLAAVESGEVRIGIRDTGVGISPEHLPRIFDEFFQLRNPERDPTKGSGLGLTICKRLLDALGGDLRVESRVGEGTRFIIELPRRALIEATGRPASGGHGDGEGDGNGDGNSDDKGNGSGPGDGRDTLDGMRLLLVEDHHTTRAATARILRRHGAMVAEAPDGTSALKLIDEFEPHVVLLDMMLPDMSGADVLRKARRDTGKPGCRVVIMSGDVTPERMTEVESLGAEAFIPKPVDLHRLVGLLKRPARGGFEGRA